MKKILLLNPPGKKIYLRDNYCSHQSKGAYCWPPNDLLAISGLIGEKHKLSVVDAIARRINDKKCLNIISALKVDYIIFLSGVVSRNEDEEFLEKIKECCPVTKIVITGDYLLEEKELIFQENPNIDAVLLDYSSKDLLSYLEDGMNFSTSSLLIRNLSINTDEKKRDYKYSINIPRHDLFDHTLYSLPQLKKKKFTTVQSSFGCPFNCSFCPQERILYKERELEELFEEFKYLYKNGYEEIWFSDQTFGVNKNRIYSICNELILQNYCFEWSCEIRVDLIEKELIKKMKRAGCHTVFIGVETASQDILDHYNKGITLEQIKRCFHICRDHRIKTCAHIILGLPGETVKSTEETIKFVLKLNPDYCSFNIAAPPPNTTFKKKALENNWFDKRTNCYDNSVSYPVISTDTLSSGELWELKKNADRKFFFRCSYVAKLVKNNFKFFQIKNLILNFYYYFTNSFF